MIALQIQDIKQFMNKLLLSQTFDRFLFVEGSITTFHTVRIDGRLQKEFFSDETELLSLKEREFALWNEIRPFCLELIKGKKTPLAFQLTFQLSGENTQKLLAASSTQSILPEQVSGLLINVRFEHDTLNVITAANYRVFTLDKTLEYAWDDMVKRFLKQQEISFL